MFYFHKVAYVQYLGEVDIFHTRVKKFIPLYNSAKIVKSIKIFQSYDHKCTATFLWLTVYIKMFSSLSNGPVFWPTLYIVPPRIGIRCNDNSIRATLEWRHCHTSWTSNEGLSNDITLPTHYSRNYMSTHIYFLSARLSASADQSVGYHHSIATVQNNSMRPSYYWLYNVNRLDWNLDVLSEIEDQ